jgi:MFS family permease
MSVGMFGTILFIPLYIQGVIGTNATDSGTVLMPLMITMIGSSVVAGQIISRTGRYKLSGLVGMTGMAIGLYLLSGMGPDTDYLTVVRNMVIIGLGMGPTMPVFTLAAQNAVRVNQLGVVTSLTQFARSIGSTIGVALFGSLLTNEFAPAFKGALPPQVTAAVPPAVLGQFENPQVLLSPEIGNALRQQVLGLGEQGGQLFDALYAAIRIGLVGALHDVFLVGAALGVVGVLVTLFLKELPLRKSYAPSEVSLDETAAQVGKDAFPSLPPLRPQDQPAVQAARERGLVA